MSLTLFIQDIVSSAQLFNRLLTLLCSGRGIRASVYNSDASGPALLTIVVGRRCATNEKTKHTCLRGGPFGSLSGQRWRQITERLEHAVTVKEVLLDQGRAEAEVERLNKLNADKQCHSFAAPDWFPAMTTATAPTSTCSAPRDGFFVSCWTPLGRGRWSGPLGARHRLCVIRSANV